MFIEAQEVSHFNYTDNSLSDTVTPRVDAVKKSLCFYSYPRPEDTISQYQTASFWDKRISTWVLAGVTEI